MNVTELARILNLPTKLLLKKLPELGFHIGTKAIKVNDKLVPKIMEAFKGDEKRQREAVEQAKIREIRKEKRRKGESVEFEKHVSIPSKISVRDFATSLNLPVAKVIGELMMNGVMASLNQEIDFDIATIIAENFGFGVSRAEDTEKIDTREETAAKRITDIKMEDLEKGVSRPPVIVIMGHVDHGKTSLLDAIRSTDVVATESGGITQRIGAYQIHKNGRLITFLDTPGHEAFRAMRSRGGRIADIAILVVSADDGIQPQTLESINIIQKENLPYVVAINKIDKPGADIDRIKSQLSEINLTPDDWGGKTMCVPISAKKNEHIDTLLDTVLIVADIENFLADPDKGAFGTVIESHVDKGEGPVATILVQSGTLRIGDFVRAGNVFGKVKTMIDSFGKQVTEATPSTPVKLLGLKEIPSVGELVESTNNDEQIREWKKNSKNTKKVFRTMEHSQTTSSQQECENKDDDQKRLAVIVKGDVFGSVGAIVDSIKKMDTHNIIRVIKQGLGNINDSDIIAADTSHAIVVGFKVKIDRDVALFAKEKKVDCQTYDVIYQLLDYVKTEAEKLLEKEIVRKEVGKLKVLEIFRTEKKFVVIGGQVLDGIVFANCKGKILHNNECVGWSTIESLRSGKEEVKEVAQGADAGIRLAFTDKIIPGDIIEFFTEEEIKRKL